TECLGDPVWRRADEAGDNGNSIRIRNLNNSVAALSRFLEIDQHEVGFLAGNDQFPSVKSFRIRPSRLEIAGEHRDNQSLSEGSDQVLRTRAHLAQKGYAGEDLLHLLPQRPQHFLNFSGTASILEEIVDRPIVP